MYNITLRHLHVTIVAVAKRYYIIWGRDSTVSIENRYRLNSPGIESLWEVRLSTSIQNGPGGPPSILYNAYRIFPGVKAVGAWP
jgi:hypothetical protein